MKSLVFLLGILAFVTSVHCKVTYAQRGKPVEKKEEYLRAINDKRREYAKKWEIPNMNKLVWDDYLATQVEMRDYSCNWKTCRESRRDGDDNTEKFNERHTNSFFGEANRQTLVNQYKTFFMARLEDLTPGQQKIGCYHLSATDDGKMDNGTDIGCGVLKTETICFLTPEGLGDSWKLPKGEAGSACAEGFVNDDGLCAPKVKSSGNSGNSGSSSSAQKDKESGSNEENSTESNGQSSKMSGVVISLVMMVVVKFL